MARKVTAKHCTFAGKRDNPVGIHQRRRRSERCIPLCPPARQISDNEHLCGQIIGFQYRPRLFGKILISVVEGDQQRPALKRVIVCDKPRQLLRVDRMVAVSAQPQHLLRKRIRIDAIARKDGASPSR
jgi:hypothetical protein